MNNARFPSENVLYLLQDLNIGQQGYISSTFFSIDEELCCWVSLRAPVRPTQLIWNDIFVKKVEGGVIAAIHPRMTRTVSTALYPEYMAPVLELQMREDK